MHNDKNYIQVGTGGFISSIGMRLIFKGLPRDKQIEIIGKPIEELSDEELRVAYNQFNDRFKNQHLDHEQE